MPGRRDVEAKLGAWAAKARLNRLPRWLIALAGYAALAVLLTWPLVLHLADRFPGQRPDDAWGHYWNLWWFHQAVSRGQSPYHTPLWYPPAGVDLWVGTLGPINGLLGFIPQSLAGPLVAYNLVVLANLTFAGLAGFLLARQATGHTGGAAVAGLAVAASPFLIGQLNIGHLNVTALYGAPLFAYALLRAADGCRWHVLLAAVALPLVALGEWQNAVSALLVAGILLVWQVLAALRGHRPWRAPLRMVIAGLLAGLLLLPLVVPTAQAIEAAGPTAEMGERVNRAANLLAFFLPQELHPLWGDFINKWRRDNLWEPVTAGLMPLGLSVLGLAALGVARYRRATLPWLVILGLGMGLAMGPELHIGREDYDLPTPFTLFRNLPYMNVSRNPARYVFIATLGAAVLAAFGVRWLAGLPAAGRRQRLVVGAVGALVLGELWTVPYPLSVPPDTLVAQRVGQEVAALDSAGVLLPLPYKPYEQHILFHQVHHGRPIYSTGGAIERLPEPPLRTQTPGFADLADDDPFVDIYHPAPDPLAVLNYFRVHYVLYYPKEVPERQRARYQRTLRRVLGQPGPTYAAADGTLEAWRVPATAPAPAFLRTGEGWHPTETWEGLGLGRWMAERATLYLERSQPAAITLTATAVSFVEPRRVEVSADGQSLGVFTITPIAGEITLRLPPGQGTTRLVLRSLDGADSPRHVLDVRDNRRLSVGFTNVHLATQPMP